MEGGTTTIELTILIALGGVMVAAVALLSGVWFRLGQLSNHVAQLDRRFDQQAEENRETREENRRNHQQLLQALAHHSHGPDTGFAVFRIPPGTENPAG